ncbi:MAG: adenylosuccinate lyase [Halobacteriales archaeon]|nr:adenylosuccinate lyase [Halobacteriales archaeon]
MTDPLDAVSPLDGRYAGRTAPLRPYASEAALMRARTRVEVEYLLALADEPGVPLELDGAERERSRAVYGSFDADDAGLIKRLETEGAAGYAATNHDVKAVEYFLRIRLDGLERAHPWLHFGLTSEDVTNLAYRLLVRGAVDEVLAPELEAVRGRLVSLAREHRDAPMLARTHGQPATPTTFGKELAVYAARLDAGLDRLAAATGDLAGKLAGASGTYAAHHAALPDVDWRAVSAAFVDSLGLRHQPLATQVNPGDDLAAVFDALRGLNRVLVDLDRDCWQYVSLGYLRQRTAEGETGSSTMPHKVNPIDFENAEGNLEKATSDLDHLAGAVTTSRLQRDLSDSTVKRNVGAALAHCLIGYTKTAAGLESIAPDAEAMRADLEAHPEVLAEAIQTVLRREGHADAYERVKALTRGEAVTLDSLRAAIDDLDVDDDVRDELASLEPVEYVGLASALVDEL